MVSKTIRELPQKIKKNKKKNIKKGLTTSAPYDIISTEKERGKQKNEIYCNSLQI